MENGKWKMENEQTSGAMRVVVRRDQPLAPQTSLRDGPHWGRVPGLESPGYLQASLRDEPPADFWAGEQGVAPLQGTRGF
jgi:hypothetical protein